MDLVQLMDDGLRQVLPVVDLVDGHHNGHVLPFHQLNHLLGLGHDPVIRCHHQDHNVRHQGPCLSHCAEGLVPGSVDKGHEPLGRRDSERADRLCDASDLSLCDVRMPQAVQDSGLAMVDVPHDGHHWGPADVQLLLRGLGLGRHGDCLGLTRHLRLFQLFHLVRVIHSNSLVLGGGCSLQSADPGGRGGVRDGVPVPVHLAAADLLLLFLRLGLGRP
mmetsp:Transcript_47727/g.85225  ORF Transcript_47727/g.85225 Transcript_47727/m.85225 type:complete len:218 (+) Transcript_47727:1787-2440(+)